MDSTITHSIEPHTISPASLSNPAEGQLPAHLPSPAPSDMSCSPSPDDPQSPSDSSDTQSKKKRKSWGQVLPEPTTNLPPRKRAKTDAEKQQRKYERVQRNRQAAHNSRLRKQNEMDRLAGENNNLKQTIADQECQLRQLRQTIASLRKAIIPEVKLEADHDSTYDSDQTSASPPSFDTFSTHIAQSADTHSAEMC